MGVTVYVMDGCPYCSMLVEELKGKGVVFEEINVSRDAAAAEHIKRAYGADRVPVMVDENGVTIGYRGKMG